MQTSGLCNTNAGRRETVGGLTREFHERILRHYRERHGEDSPQVRDCDGGFFFEPHAALAVYRTWLAEADRGREPAPTRLLLGLARRLLDASHGAVFMMLRHVCGAAAAACPERGIAVHDLPPEDLRRLLAADGQVLDAWPFTAPWPRTRPR